MSHICIFQPQMDKRHGIRAYVLLRFTSIRFVDDELGRLWYVGKCCVPWLQIRTDRLRTIHAGAFNRISFHCTRKMELYLNQGVLTIREGVFDSLEKLQTLRIVGRLTVPIPIAAMALRIKRITFVGLPNHSLADLFAAATYRRVVRVHISNVQWPQTQFRQLVAADFAAFRQLTTVILNYCGITVIEEQAFDYVGRTLTTVDLRGNRIKALTVDMFRRMYESHRSESVVFQVENEFSDFVCTCQFVELVIMQCPFQTKKPGNCLECTLIANFHTKACDVYRNVPLPTMCINWNEDTRLRIVQVRLTHENGAILLDTRFSSKMRVIFVNFDAMAGRKCAARATKMNFKCLRIDRSTDYLELNEIEEVRGARLISITVIPILFEFGARATHTITVRSKMVAPERWPVLEMLILCAAIVLGIGIGFGGGTCWHMSMQRREKSTLAATETATPKNIECEYLPVY